jgi:hypothetical protein
MRSLYEAGFRLGLGFLWGAFFLMRLGFRLGFRFMSSLYEARFRLGLGFFYGEHFFLTRFGFRLGFGFMSSLYEARFRLGLGFMRTFCCEARVFIICTDHHLANRSSNLWSTK